MKKILIATSNKAKIEELMFGFKLLKDLNIEILTLDGIRVEEKPKEIGKTFCDNAKIKAKFYGDLTGYPTIADDGGLVIPFLNNEPGVKSRRWLGYEASDEELIRYTLLRLEGIERSKRTAYLEVCLCFYHPKTKKDICQKEKIKGYIAEKPSGNATKGYPFRALLIVDQFNKYYDELTEEEHLIANHRLKALRKLITKLKQLQLFK